MSYTCPACGSASYRAERYKCPAMPLTLKRRIFDFVQYIGWRLLPLESLPAAVAKRFAQGLFKFRTVRVCQSCGLGIIHPMCQEQELSRFYGNFYIGRHQGALPPIDARGLSQAWFLGEYIAIDAVADSFEFGAGSAALSRALHAASPKMRSVVAELGNSMRDALAQDPSIHQAVDIYRGPDQAFDLIVASHALEHVISAPAVMKQWFDMLRPGGHLFVEVPNADRDHYRVEHEYIPHTWFFTSRSLDLIARTAGLETVIMATGGPTYADAIAGKAHPASPDWHLTHSDGAQLRGLWRKPAA